MLLTGILALWTVVLVAQTPGTGVPGGRQQPGQQQRGATGAPLRSGQQPEQEDNTPFFGEGSEVEPANDTVKRRRPKMPLESYHFSDEERARLNMVWTLDTYSNHIRTDHIDTLQMDFQNQYPFMKEGVGSAYLGNLGAPSQALSWFDRPRGRRTSFADPWSVYLRTAETMPFYNVKTPFSQLSYGWAGQKAQQEEDLHVIHAQNISPQTGFNIDYRSLGTKGIYRWQGTRDKSLSIGFNHTGKRWTLHAGYIHNRVYNQENGGITDDDEILIRLNDHEITTAIPMRMSSPKNHIRSNTFFLTQSLGLPLVRVSESDFTIGDRPAVFFGHTIEYDRWSRRYEDTYAGTIFNDISGQSQPRPYYDDWFYSPTASRDSLFESRLSNRLFVQLQPWDRNGPIGTIDAGVGVDLRQYYQFSADQYLTGTKNRAVNETEYYAWAGIDGHAGIYLDWSAHARYHPFGARGGDVDIGGEATARLFIKERAVTLSGRLDFSSLDPSYWDRNFSSNHFMWSNSFSKETETRLDASLEIPHVGFTATLSQSLLDSKVYYALDDSGREEERRIRPMQAAEVVSVTGVYLREDLRIGLGAASSVNLNHRVMLQWSTDQRVVPVPLASAYLSYFYEFNVVRDVLRLQIGVDGRYNTPYHAPGYNPGAGRFYNQREKELGDYLWLDAFVNAKWKRMRIMVKMQHLNDDMFPSRNFFSVLHYPMNRRILKIGVSWNFYD